MRQVRDDAHPPVVDGRLDRLGMRAERARRTCAGAGRACRRSRARREVPDGAVEEVAARVRDAGRLGPRDRMAADEARVAVRRRRRPAPSTDPTSLTTQSGPAARSASATSSPRASTGAAANATSAPARAPSSVGAASSTAPCSRATGRTSGSGSQPTTCAPARSREQYVGCVLCFVQFSRVATHNTSITGFTLNAGLGSNGFLSDEQTPHGRRQQLVQPPVSNPQKVNGRAARVG